MLARLSTRVRTNIRIEMDTNSKHQYERPEVEVFDLRALGMSLNNEASPFVVDVGQYIDGDGLEGEDQF